jgi:hypothetical protein
MALLVPRFYMELALTLRELATSIAIETPMWSLEAVLPPSELPLAQGMALFAPRYPSLGD